MRLGLLWCCGVLLVPRTAGATIADCAVDDAPNAYETSTCQGVCTQTGSELTCETDTLCAGMNGAGATIVTNFDSSTHDLSAWGGCLATNIVWCCVFDE